jgi:hypothetical protein
LKPDVVGIVAASSVHLEVSAHTDDWILFDVRSGGIDHHVAHAARGLAIAM